MNETESRSAGRRLALVRQIADRHGGKARCEAPADGSGSRFSGVLNLDATDRP